MAVDPNRAKSIFLAASEKPPAERAGYLNEVAGADAELRARVEALLKAHEDPDSFLDDPGAQLPTMDRPPAAALVERPGTFIGPYKLLEQIGEGGMGVVYMADQQSPIRRRVALKIIKAGMDTRQVIARFEVERQVLALMDHSNIARVFDGGATASGRPYFVMELVRGIPITEYCDQNNLPVHQRLELFVQVCHAVQHAHQKGIIHRDIKPSNVLVTLNDGRPVPKVIDFGVAKATNQQLTEKTLFTAFAQMVGTPLYMSPEQAEMSSLDIDTRSDIYSLGVLLYELLTGTTPFDQQRLRAAAYDEMRRIIREEEPPKPSTRISTLGEARTATAAHRQIDPHRLGQIVRGDLDWIVMKSLEKDRTRRYATANDFAADVARHLGNQPVAACPPTAGYRIRKFVYRNRLSVAAASIVLVTLIAGIIGSTLGLLRALDAEEVVKQQNEVVISERDHAVRAESEAQTQRQKAEAETRRAQLQLANSLISQGDALVSAGEFRAAYARFADAEAALRQIGESLARLDLSLVRLYRVSPPPLWTTSVPGGKPRASAMLPSGRELLIAGHDMKFHEVDLLTGESLRSFGDCQGIACLAAAQTAAGPIVVAGGFKRACVIDPIRGAVIREALDDRAMKRCVLSPDGSIAASINQAGGIVLWEPATLKRVAECNRAETLGLAMSHDGSMIASVYKDNVVALWNARSGKQIRVFDEAPIGGKVIRGCECVAFSADDRVVECGAWEGIVASYTVEGKPLGVRQPHEGEINFLLAAPEGARLISLGGDKMIKVFEPDIDPAQPTLTLVNPSINGFALFLAGNTGPEGSDATRGLAVADQGVAVAVDAKNETTAWPLVAPHRQPGRLAAGMAMSRDGLLIAGYFAGRCEIRDATTGRTVRALHDSAYCNATAFSPDSRHLYIGLDDGTLMAFDPLRNRYEWSVHAHDGGQIWSIDVSADGALLGTGGGDAARVWDARTGKLLAGTRGKFTPVAFLPCGPAAGATATAAGASSPSLVGRRLVVAGPANAYVDDWDLATSAPPRRLGEFRYLREMTLSPDRKLLAVVGYAQDINLLDALTLHSAARLGPVQNYIYSLRFIDAGDGPGKWAISSGETELRAWDLSTREEKLVLDTGARYGGNCLLAAPDGSSIYAQSCGRIDFTLPRRLRDLKQNPSTAKRADWYGRWGLWKWTAALVDREQAAGRDMPALLAARAHWICGDESAARGEFARAVAQQSIPAWYAELCLTGDATTRVPPLAPAARPADPNSASIAAAPLPEGVLSATDVNRLRTMIGEEIVAEGLVANIVWTKQGKHLTIEFTGGDENTPGLVCHIKQKERAFDEAFAGDAAKAFSGARLRVRGKLTAYRGKRADLAGWPEMILDDPGQVTILTDASGLK